MSAGRVVATGAGAAVVAAAANAALAGIARAAGVDFEVAGGETIPVSGVAFMTAVLSGAGVVLAVALDRWSGRPVHWWVRTTVVLTALSLVPPFLAGADGATVATLVLLHLVAAAVVVPAVARVLRPVAAATASARPPAYSAGSRSTAD